MSLSNRRSRFANQRFWRYLISTQIRGVLYNGHCGLHVRLARTWCQQATLEACSSTWSASLQGHEVKAQQELRP